MLANISGEAKEITTDLEDDFEIYLVDQEHPMEKVELSPKAFLLENNQVAFLKKKETALTIIQSWLVFCAKK